MPVWDRHSHKTQWKVQIKKLNFIFMYKVAIEVMPRNQITVVAFIKISQKLFSFFNK